MGHEQIIADSAGLNGITPTQMMHLHRGLVDIVQAPEAPNLVHGEARPRLFNVRLQALIWDDSVAIVATHIDGDVPLAVTHPFPKNIRPLLMVVEGAARRAGAAPGGAPALPVAAEDGCDDLL